MTVIHHPHDDTDYEYLPDTTIRVRDGQGREGIFRVGGDCIVGDLDEVDIQMLRLAYDLGRRRVEAMGSAYATRDEDTPRREP